MQKSLAKNNKNTLLMTQGNIWKLLITFSIPLIIGNLLQQMYNTADSIIVGNFVGSNGLAAVGSGTALINLIIAFAQGASVGAGVVVSQYIGADKKDKIKISVHTSICISIILGLILSLLGFFASPSLLIMMKTPKVVLKSSILYLQIYCGGLIFNVIYNMATGILNAAGNSKKPLVYLAIASFTNIILDLLFIKIFKLGVMGAAIATDISQAISCILAIGYLLKVKSDYKLYIKDLKINKETAVKIIKIGLPTAIQNMVISFSNVLGTHVRAVQYQKGSIGKSHNEDKKYWKQYIMSGMYSGDYDLAKGKSPKFVTEKGEKYSFKVKKNGKYTIWISDDKGNIYTKVVTVKGLKK